MKLAGKFWSLVIALAVLMPASAWAQEEEADESADREPAGGITRAEELFGLHHFRGENRFVYRYRTVDGDHDHDFYDYWILTGRDLFKGWLDLHFSGRLHKDLDGTSQSLADDIFTSVEDRNDGWREQIYQLYADFHDPEGLFGLRAGRQYIEAADALHLDGINLRFLENERFSGQIFLGQPVSYYSSDSDDLAAGLSLQGRLWEGNRTRVTYVRYEDDRVNESDDRYVIDTWNRIGDQIHLHGEIAFLDDQFEKIGADAYYFALDGGFDAIASVFHYGGLHQESRAYSPLYSVLGELDPYTFIHLRLHKQILPWFTISPGASWRIADSEDNDYSNRQYGNYDLTFLFEPVEYWTFLVSGQYWDVDGGDRFWGVTGEIEYRSGGLVEAALGTSYLDYRFDVISDYGYTEENGDIVGHTDGVTTYVTRISPDVYTVYGRLDLNFTDNLELKLRGEIEDDSVLDDLSFGLRSSLVVRF